MFGDLSGLTIGERLALKGISNGEPMPHSFRLIGRFKALGLIHHNGQQLRSPAPFREVGLCGAITWQLVLHMTGK